MTVPELLLTSSRLATSTINGRVFVTETDGTELERNVDVGHTNLNIDTGLIYAVEYNLDTGKIYFSDRNMSTLWEASLDNELRGSDDRQVRTCVYVCVCTEMNYSYHFLACFK